MSLRSATVVSGTFDGIGASEPLSGFQIDIIGTGTGTINIEEDVDGTWVVLEQLVSPHCVYEPATGGTIRLNSTAAGANFTYQMRSRIIPVQ